MLDGKWKQPVANFDRCALGRKIGVEKALDKNLKDNAGPRFYNEENLGAASEAQPFDR
jgi:hypothetical protein